MNYLEAVSYPPPIETKAHSGIPPDIGCLSVLRAIRKETERCAAVPLDHENPHHLLPRLFANELKNKERLYLPPNSFTLRQITLTSRPEEIFPPPPYYHITSSDALEKLLNGQPLLPAIVQEALGQTIEGHKKNSLLLFILFAEELFKDYGVQLGDLECCLWTGTKVDSQQIELEFKRGPTPLKEISSFLETNYQISYYLEQGGDPPEKIVDFLRRSLASFFYQHLGTRGSWLKKIVYGKGKKTLPPEKELENIRSALSEVSSTIGYTKSHEIKPSESTCFPVVLELRPNFKQDIPWPVSLERNPGTIIPFSAITLDDISGACLVQSDERTCSFEYPKKLSEKKALFETENRLLLQMQKKGIRPIKQTDLPYLNRPNHGFTCETRYVHPGAETDEQFESLAYYFHHLGHLCPIQNCYPVYFPKELEKWNEEPVFPPHWLKLFYNRQAAETGPVHFHPHDEITGYREQRILSRHPNF